MSIENREGHLSSVRAIAFVTIFCVTSPAFAQTTPSAESMTDSFETKMKLLEEAWAKGDFDLARSLTHSLRDTVAQTQNEEENPGPSLVETGQFNTVDSLPAGWREWAKGWSFYKLVTISESAGEERISEPVEVQLGFPAEQTTSLAREIRVARQVGAQLVEVPSQVYHECRRGEERHATILWLADSGANAEEQYLILYGNPDAELPDYPSDLVTEGDGYGLDITNKHFRIALSRQTGQIERMTLKREHGLELFSGGEGHGEPPGIDWAHDYVDGDNFQKFRISLWDQCPEYEVVRGPLCTIVRRWGFPHSPLHPLYTPARLHIDVEYRFYTGLPWFHKSSEMKAVQTFDAAALRDDEWVFSGQSFTSSMWMTREGELRFGEVDAEHLDDIWGVGFYNETSQDSFMALFLDHSADGLPELKHTGAPLSFYRWHGPVWSRYPLPVKTVPQGAGLRQKNAYLSIPFTKEEGKRAIEEMRRAMRAPLQLSPGAGLNIPKSPTQSGQLARPGEGGEQSEIKQQIWQALRDCKDAQLYTADINVVDLGLVYDVRVRGDVVTLVMAMPHRGRPLIDYFTHGSIAVHSTLSVPVRERLEQLAGVRQVVVEQTWAPGWSSNRLTDEGRKKLGFRSSR
ncbi:MAG: hypothetical protein CMJ46_16070 [Planctomyces sp.]|nr:hypothetical protein [Planctomyces sp.]